MFTKFLINKMKFANRVKKTVSNNTNHSIYPLFYKPTYFLSSKQEEVVYPFLPSQNINEKSTFSHLTIRNNFESLHDIENFLAKHSGEDEAVFFQTCIMLKKEIGEKLHSMISDLPLGISWQSAGATEDVFDILTDLLKSISSYNNKLLFCRVLETPLKGIIRDLLGNNVLPITTYNSETSNIILEALPEVIPVCLSEHPNQLHQLLSHVNVMKPQVKEQMINRIVDFLLEEKNSHILRELDNIEYGSVKELVRNIREEVQDRHEQNSIFFRGNKI